MDKTYTNVIPRSVSLNPCKNSSVRVATQLLPDGDLTDGPKKYFSCFIKPDMEEWQLAKVRAAFDTMFGVQLQEGSPSEILRLAENGELVPRACVLVEEEVPGEQYPKQYMNKPRGVKAFDNRDDETPF